MAKSSENRGFSFDWNATPQPNTSWAEEENPHFSGETRAEGSFELDCVGQDQTPPVKKIRFPGATTGAAARAPVPSPPANARSVRSAEEAEPRNKTHFSASIGQTRPPLDSSDELAFPEDLPDDPAFHAPSWPQETPSLPALWRKTKNALRDAAQEASQWSKQGAQKSQDLASEIKKALRSRPPRAETPNATEPPSAHPAAPPPEPLEEPRVRAHVPETRGFRPEVATSLLRKLRAPLTALGVAAGVYLGSAQFFGHLAGPALSRTTAVPDLGSLPTSPPKSEEKGSAKTSPKSEKSTLQGSPDSTSSAAPKSTGPKTEQLPLPEGLSYPGKGLIEVVTAEEELIYVNGVFIGRGPLRRVPVSPGEHAVSIRNGGTEKTGTLEVVPARTTRIVFVEKL